MKAVLEILLSQVQHRAIVARKTEEQSKALETQIKQALAACGAGDDATETKEEKPAASKSSKGKKEAAKVDASEGDDLDNDEPDLDDFLGDDDDEPKIPTEDDLRKLLKAASTNEDRKKAACALMKKYSKGGSLKVADVPENKRLAFAEALKSKFKL